MPVKADESLPMVNFKVSKSTAGELLASQFINRTNRDRLKLYVDQETQQLIFDSIVFITSGVSIFGLMYGLDSLLIAGAIASFWAYLALFVAGLLLKNIVLGWLTNNFFPDRPDHYLNAKKLLKTSAVSCLLLYFLLIIEPLPNPLFLWFCCL